MKELRYSCEKDELHPALQKVFHEKKSSSKTVAFQIKKTRHYRIKFIFFILLRAFGWKHYDTMGILGYHAYLLDDSIVEEITGGKRVKYLLDIGAGDGSITQKFEKYVDQIDCIEPSISFQYLLKDRGYAIASEKNKKYEIVTIFNVFDVCENPNEIMHTAICHLNDNGNIAISLPFPIQIRSKGEKSVERGNLLAQHGSISFEKGVSQFYETFLKANNLEVIYFTRLPYIVALPESRSTNLYDNGLFICKKKLQI